MIKCVMIQLCRCLFRLSYLASYIQSCDRLFGRAATFIIVSVQLLIVGWFVQTMIRAPD